MKGLQLSVDWYRITVDDAISTLGGGGIQSVLDLCYNTIRNAASVYCRAINRDPVTGQIAAPTYVMTTNANIGGIATRGVDLAGHYNFTAGRHPVDARFQLDVRERADVHADPGPADAEEPLRGHVGRHVRPARAALEGHDARQHEAGTAAAVGPRPLHGARDGGLVCAGRQPARAGIADQSEDQVLYLLDLTAGYEFSRTVNLTGGVRNVLDKDPPILGSAQLPANNTIPATYDPLGRQCSWP